MLNEEQKDKFIRTCGIALLVILLHGMAFLLLDKFMPEPPKNKAPVKIQHLTVAKGQLTKNKVRPNLKNPAHTTKKTVPEKKPEEEKVDISKLDKQIVNVPPTENKKPPKDAKYLSSFNTNVEKETRAKNTDKDYKQVTNVKSGENKTEIPLGKTSVTELNKPALEQPAPESGAQVPEVQPTMLPQKKLALEEAASGQFQNHPAVEQHQGTTQKYRLKLNPTKTMPGEILPESAGSPMGTAALKLFPDKAQLAKIAGSPANDYLPDVEEGEGTFLNSREFKYASFFNRIHQSVSSNWDPRTVLAIRDPTGNLYGYKNRTTVVHVILNKSGSLLDISLVETCGVNSLDDEAIAAFRRAAPFPNPPAAIFDSSGRLEINFGFIVDYGH